MAIDRSLLPAQSPFDLMDRESARIDAFLSELVSRGDDDPAWRAPTRCAAWDARALFGHLRHIEDYNAACLSGTVRELIAGAEVAQEFDDFNAAGVAQYSGVPVAELLEQWRTKNAAYRAAMRAIGDGVVDTSVGEYPSLFQAYYLATEYAANGDDFGVAATYDGRDAWRAAFARFALMEQQKPLELVVNDGWTVVTFEGEQYVVTDHDVAEAAVARATVADLPKRLRAALRCAA